MNRVEGCPLQLGESNCGMVVLRENVPLDAKYPPADMRGCNVASCKLTSVQNAAMRAIVVSEERAEGPDFDTTALAPYQQLLPPNPQRPQPGDYNI